ncbi:MAG: helix-turn-helix domain-containing protein [Clostridia bacterium]|nr:helix-turn-helix domain-containing protein [Clostridia bacterium]
MEQESFANRLSKALIIRNMKPIDLAKISGINKATISQYLSGRYKAKQNNIYILAKALNINEAWLMGFDTNIDRIPDNERTQIMTYTSTDDSMLPLLGIDDVAYVLPQDTYISGETIYFRLENKLMIRKIIDNNGSIEFHAMNPYYPILKCTAEELNQKEFIVIGKVIKVENKSAFK